MTNIKNFLERQIRIGRLLCRAIYAGRVNELSAWLQPQGLNSLVYGGLGAGNVDLKLGLDQCIECVINLDPIFFDLLAGTYRYDRRKVYKNAFWLGPEVSVPKVWESIDGVGRVRGKEILLYLCVAELFLNYAQIAQN